MFMVITDILHSVFYTKSRISWQVLPLYLSILLKAIYDQVRKYIQPTTTKKLQMIASCFLQSFTSIKVIPSQISVRSDSGERVNGPWNLAGSFSRGHVFIKEGWDSCHAWSSRSLVIYIFMSSWAWSWWTSTETVWRKSVVSFHLVLTGENNSMKH